MPSKYKEKLSCRLNTQALVLSRAVVHHGPRDAQGLKLLWEGSLTQSSEQRKNQEKEKKNGAKWVVSWPSKVGNK